MKQLILKGLSITIFLIVLTGCDYLDYKNAQNSKKNGEYREAINTFELLGDYKDSKEQLVKTIDLQVQEMVIREKYDEIEELIAKYESTIDLVHIKEYVSEEKTKFDLYNEAIDYVLLGYIDNELFDRGTNILKELPNGYKNRDKILTSYEEALKCPLIGRYRNRTGLNNISQYVRFWVDFIPEEDQFGLRVYKAVYDSSSSVFAEHDYYWINQNFETLNSVSKDYFTWYLDKEGTFYEKEKGQECKYYSIN